MGDGRTTTEERREKNNNPTYLEALGTLEEGEEEAWRHRKVCLSFCEAKGKETRVRHGINRLGLTCMH